jgi:hypothetical protein
MYGHRVKRARIVADKYEPPTGIGRHRHDGPHPEPLVSELVFPPTHALICTKQNMVGWLFVICHNQNRPRVSKLPQMCVFVNLGPRKSSVTAKESVALCVR